MSRRSEVSSGLQRSLITNVPRRDQISPPDFGPTHKSVYIDYFQDVLLSDGVWMRGSRNILLLPSSAPTVWSREILASF